MEASFYPYIAAFAWIGIFLMIGTWLRYKIKFLQKLLFPASLIGGILGFIVMNVWGQFTDGGGVLGWPSSQGWKYIQPGVFSMITFHLFAFGFVGIGLLQNKSKSSETAKSTTRGSLWIALLFGMLFATQAMVGYFTFEGWQSVFGGEFYTKNGYLLGAGFAQGPGQTQAYATIWETMYQTANSVNVGLAFAAVGFLVAGLVGVPVAYYGIKKAWLRKEAKAGKLPKDFLCGMMDRGKNPPVAFATTHPANIDSLAFHLGIMCAVYGAAYLWGLAWFIYMPKGINGLGIGMIFAWGMFISMILRKILGKVDALHIIDPETTRRLTSSTVDFMICGVFMGIKVSALNEVLFPFIIAIILGAIVTLFICIWFGRRSPELGFERGISLFGYCTGTAASALLLLRVVDPEYDTSVAVEIGLMNVWAVLLFKPISWSMPFVPVVFKEPILGVFDNFPIIFVFLAMVIITPIAMKLIGLIKKPSF